MVITNGQTLTLNDLGTSHWKPPMLDTVNPLGVTTNRRAVCGRPARTVRREGRRTKASFLPLSKQPLAALSEKIKEQEPHK